MGRYLSETVDPQSKKKMTAIQKVLGEESLSYDVMDVNMIFVGDGRIDLVSNIIYGAPELWIFIMNKNYEYLTPFDLLEKDFEIENANGKKFIRIPRLTTNINTLMGGSSSGATNTLNL